MKKLFLMNLFALMHMSVWAMEVGEQQTIEEVIAIQDVAEQELKQIAEAARSAIRLLSQAIDFNKQILHKSVDPEQIRRLKNQIQEYEDQKELLAKSIKEKQAFFEDEKRKHLQHLEEQKKEVSQPSFHAQKNEELMPQQQQPLKKVAYGKYGASAGAAIFAGAAAVWGGLTLWQERTIANVLAQFNVKPDDLTQRQRNLLAATFSARYNPWALQAYAGKYDEHSPIYNFPHAWQILRQLYFVRKPTRNKIVAFKNYMLFGK